MKSFEKNLLFRRCDFYTRRKYEQQRRLKERKTRAFFKNANLFEDKKKKTLEKITFDNYLPLMKTALKMKVVVVDSHDLIEQLIHFREKYYREQKLTETEQFYSQIYRHSVIRKRDISITNDDDDDDDERVIVGRAISEQGNRNSKSLRFTLLTLDSSNTK